ncbi:MAG TPA: SGNH/GDSL hydrolase family protein [Clostridiales bacterium]|nr:SGNH/GDSL hydrolase family protein [Clostridiales bacterium]
MQKRLKKPLWCSLGDSITFRNSWQPFVTQALELTHVNCGIGSTTVAFPARHVTRPAFCTDERLGLGEYAHVKRLVTDDGVPYAPVLSHAPDIVTIFGGANDTLYTKALGDESELAKPIEEKDRTVFFGAYSYVVEALRKHQPGVNLFLITLFPMTSNHQIPVVITQEECNRAIRKIAEYYNLPVIDLAQELGHWKEEYLPFLPDGVHPNEEGGRVIAKVVTEALRPVIG